MMSDLVSLMLYYVAGLLMLVLFPVIVLHHWSADRQIALMLAVFIGGIYTVPTAWAVVTTVSRGELGAALFFFLWGGVLATGLGSFSCHILWRRNR